MTISLGVPAVAYHASEGVSNSMLSAMAESPFHCWSKYIDPQRPANTPTAAMAAGTLLHTLVLEPALMGDTYAVMPEGLDGRTKDGKAWREAHADRIVISSDQMALALSQRDALMANAVIADMLAGCAAEATVTWVDRQTCLPCRARPDAMKREGRAVRVLDLKTTADASPDGFSRSVATYGYHRQRAHYTAGIESHGLKVEAFVFAVVSSTWPIVAMAYVLDEETEAQGEEEVAELLDLFKQCQTSGVWPTYGEGLHLIGLPKWAKRSQEIEVSYA